MGSQMMIVENVEPQPLLAQVIRIEEALEFLGSPLPRKVSQHLKKLKDQPYDIEMVRHVQEMLDPFCLAYVQINPESRVKVTRGAVPPVLMQDGWTSFLVKVHNEAHVTAELVPESPNAMPVLHKSTHAHRMAPEHEISKGDLDNRFAEVALYDGLPLSRMLSGLSVEYVVLQIYTRVEGKHELKLGFNVGQGTQDIGFRNNIDILFDVAPAVKVKLEVKDEDGSPTMASFIVTDGKDRFSKEVFESAEFYRVAKASSEHWQERGNGLNGDGLPIQKKLSGIYPLPSRRVANKDVFPDFFFQPQVYRADGEYILLPPGRYYVHCGRGPEYLSQYQIIDVPEGVDSMAVRFDLKRWIHMSELGWYSADHHIHASGCSHYESPEEGVLPEHMWRQVLGEDLNMGNNLTWGPSWYHQKQFFTGENFELSDDQNIMRYDVEVSGFPSSHAGHIVLLNLKEDDYPNTTVIEEWPSWTLPVLQWAKSQGGITGYAHSGWGLAPVEETDELPNLVMPKMDGIGANEFVVTVTHDAIDFYSAGDTPLPYELNMWYHVLNSGFKTKISGETDFPCISDERVGRARIYAKLDKGLDFEDYMEALLAGRSYVSDGFSHLIDFSVNDLELGSSESTLKLTSSSKVNIKVNAAAFLEENQDEKGRIIAALRPDQSPYWHVERSRMGTSRQVAVELVVNGVPVQEKVIDADGSWFEIDFEHEVRESAWIAVRVKYSSHTNPIFVEVDGKPILDKNSIEWCRAAVDQCWEQKHGRFKPEEVEAARKGYDHARNFYDQLLKSQD